MRKLIKSHLLPSIEHQKRAKLLSHKALFFYLVFSFVLFSGIRFTAQTKPGVLGYASNINVADLLKYTNEEREKNSLPPLSFNQDLSTAASAKAKHMFKNNYWSHVSPDGVEPWYFFGQVNYDYTFAGENLAKNFNDSRSVVRAWMNSPSHRENLLSPNYSDIGFAVANGNLNGYQTTLVVQFFGTRKGAFFNPEIDGGNKVPEEVQAPVFEVPTPAPAPVQLPIGTEKNEERPLSFPPLLEAPLVNVYSLVRVFSLSISIFLFFLFVVDIVYTSTKDVVKINGHTVAHILLLLMAVASIGVLMVPGKVF